MLHICTPCNQRVNVLQFLWSEMASKFSLQGDNHLHFKEAYLVFFECTSNEGFWLFLNYLKCAVSQRVIVSAIHWCSFAIKEKINYFLSSCIDFHPQSYYSHILIKMLVFNIYLSHLSHLPDTMKIIHFKIQFDKNEGWNFQQFIV